MPPLHRRDRIKALYKIRLARFKKKNFHWNEQKHCGTLPALLATLAPLGNRMNL